MTTRTRNVRSVVRNVSTTTRRSIDTRRVAQRSTESRRADRSISVDTLVVDGVVRLLGSRAEWQGSMTELDSAVRRVLRRKNLVEGWPQNPRGMRAIVDRLVPQFRRLGVKVRFGRTSDHARKRYVEFVR